MGQYLPYAGTNAIQEAVIGVHFGDNFRPQAVERSRAAVVAGLREEFPRSNDIHMAEVKIESTNPSFFRTEEVETARLGGFELLKVKSDGKPARVLRFVENMLTVNFLEYVNWESTLPNSLEYIRLVLSSVNLESNPITALSLRYIDRFTFDGPPNEAEAGLLLRQGNDHLTQQCFAGGPFWHCHSGWFEQISRKSRILSQLNVSSAMVDQAPTVTIDHNAIYQMKAPRQTIESLYEPPSGADSGLAGVLDRLHGLNGSILKDMLLPDMLERIGMKS